jgi:hypothetical protein
MPAKMVNGNLVHDSAPSKETEKEAQTTHQGELQPATSASKAADKAAAADTAKK